MQLPTCFLIKGLSEKQLDHYSGISREVQIKKGAWVYQEGDAAEQIFMLREGVVEFMTMVDGNIEIPVNILREPGSCFGTSALISPYLYSISARCVEDSMLLAVNRSKLEVLMQEDSELGYIIMKNLSEHLLEHLKETRKELKLHFKNLLKFMQS